MRILNLEEGLTMTKLSDDQREEILHALAKIAHAIGEVSPLSGLNPEDDEVFLFKHTGFTGPKIRINCGVNEIVQVRDVAGEHGNEWHDNVDSAKCGSGVFCALFEHSNYSGQVAVLLPGQTIRNLHRDGFGNDCDSYIAVGLTQLPALVSRVSTR